MAAMNIVTKVARRNRSNEAEDQPALARNPATTGGLSLPLSAYVGDYKNEHWGTVNLQDYNGKLVGTIGEIHLSFGSTGVNEFVVAYGTGNPDNGRFEVADDKVIQLVLMSEDFDGEARFDRN